MLDIFNFIFSCLKDLFNFLDFNLPGIDLTFVDFLLLVLIIPLIFRLVKGSFADSGDGVLYGSFDSLVGISNTAKLSYDNFNKSLVNKRFSSYSRMDKVRINHDEQLHQRHSLSR